MKPSKLEQATAADVLLSPDIIEQLEQAIGRPEVERQARLLAERLGPALDRLRDRVAAGDNSQVAAEAHRFISDTGNLGLVRLSTLFRQLQDLARSPTDGDPAASIDAVLAYISQAAQASMARLGERCERRDTSPGLRTAASG